MWMSLRYPYVSTSKTKPITSLSRIQLLLVPFSVLISAPGNHQIILALHLRLIIYASVSFTTHDTSTQSRQSSSCTSLEELPSLYFHSLNNRKTFCHFYFGLPQMILDRSPCHWSCLCPGHPICYMQNALPEASAWNCYPCLNLNWFKTKPPLSIVVFILVNRNFIIVVDKAKKKKVFGVILARSLSLRPHIQHVKFCWFGP